MGILRTLLAIIVVFAHSPYGSIFVGGQLAVQMFYVISGFLIAHVLQTNPAYLDIKRFYTNRALRIYPIYLITLALTAVYILVIDRSILYIFEQTPFLAKLLLAVSQLTIFGQDWVMFSGVRDGHFQIVSDFKDSTPQLWTALLIPQAWTLGVELSFYALAPFLMKKQRFIFLLFLGSCLVRLLTIEYGIGHKDPWTYRFFPSELALFLLGSLSNIYLLPVLLKKLTSAKRLQLFAIGGTVLLILLCATYARIPIPEPAKGYLILLFSAILLPFTFLLQRIFKIDNLVGELSYPIYIVHMLITWITAAFVAHYSVRLSALSQTLFIILESCMAAYLLNRLVSFHVEAIRARIRFSKTEACAPSAESKSFR